MSVSAHPATFYGKVSYNSIKKVGQGLLGGLGGKGLFSTIVRPQKVGTLPQKTNMPRTVGTRRVKKTVKKSNKLLTVGAAKRMLQGVLEKKQMIIYPQITAIAQGSIYTYNLTAQLTQGNADGTRVGDVVDLKNLEFNLQWYTHPAAAYYRLRVLVFWSGEEYNPGATNFGSASLSTGQLFIGAATFVTQNICNTKSINVLYDQLAEINSAVAGYEDGMTLRANITSGIAGKYTYQESGSVYGKTKNLYMVVIGNWSSTNATLPNNVGTCYVTAALKYTDA